MSERRVVLSCVVVEVIDGDTVVVECEPSDSAMDSSPWSQARTITVRLREIDAPELDQPYGEEARQALTEMVLRKTSTAVFLSGDLDANGSFLAGLECQGFEPAHSLVREGLAWGSPRDSDGYRFREAENEARAERQGLWADSSPVPPWEWRPVGQCRPTPAYVGADSGSLGVFRPAEDPPGSQQRLSDCEGPETPHSCFRLRP